MTVDSNENATATSRKLHVVVRVALLACVVATVLLCALYVYAAYQIWSNEVSVEVSEYTLTINDPPDGSTFDTYTFTGTLNLGGDAVSGTTVTLYVDDGGGYVSTGLSDVTDAMGGYSIDWTPSSAGTYKFKVEANV